MKHTIKLVTKYIFYGISWGCTFFVFMCLSYFIAGREDLLMPIFQNFARQSIGAIIVGIACGSTSIVYQFNRPSGFWKTIIHFCVGMGVFYPIGIYLGWIPFYPNRYSLLSYNFYLHVVFS